MSRSGRNSIALRTMAAFLAAVVLVGSSAMTAERPVKAFAEGEQIQQTQNAVTLEGVSVTLSGDLGVNFYLDSEDASAFDEAVVSGPQGKQSFTIADMETVTKDGKELRKFSYFVQPGQIGKDITLSLIKNGTAVEFDTKESESSVEKLTFTLGDYITKLKEESNKDTCLSALVEALETYCLYAESYFEKTAEPENVFLPAVTAEKLKKYELTSEGSLPAGVIYVGASLLLDSKTTYRLYFDGNITGATINGQLAEVGQKYGHNYIQLENIAAEDLDTVYTAKVGGCTYSFSALSYAYAVLNKEGSDSTKTIAKLVKALYAYNFAADMYNETYDSGTIDSITLDDSHISDGYYTFIYGGETYTATYTSNNWHIGDDEHHSVEIKNKADMQVICEALQKKHPVEGCITHYRTAHDMAEEWDLHNQGYVKVEAITNPLFNNYKANILSRLQDVDLDPKDQGKTMTEFVTEFLKENKVPENMIPLIIRGLNL